MAHKNPAERAIRNGDALAVRVLPRSRKNEILGLQPDGRIRIRLKAVPEGGKANQALTEFLAAVVQVPSASIHIITGTSSQNKLVLFDGLDSQEVIARIMRSAG